MEKEHHSVKELEALLAKSKFREHQYNSILDNLSECVDRESPDYTTFYVNKAFCDFYEVTPEEAYAINGMDWIVEEDRERVDRQIKRATPQHPNYHYICEIITKKGKRVWIEVLGCNFYDPQGNVVESQDVSRDITHYIEAEHLADDVRAFMEETVRIRTLELDNANLALQEANTFLQSTLNNITEGIIAIDQNGMVEFLNYGANTAWCNHEQQIRRVIREEINTENTLLYRLLFKKVHFQNAEMNFGKNIRYIVSGTYIGDAEKRSHKGLLIIRPIEEVKSFVNRFSGSNARFEFPDIIGKSNAICTTIHFAKKIAPSEGSIVIEGESGTGKELFAQAIHNDSNRNNGPFIALNCGVIPRELIGSELFGYEEGSFTGAKKGGKLGKFEMASDGTIFLDEIGDMPLEQQIALLRVIQERSVVRIGGSKEIPVDVRIICATNKNLLNEVHKGNFRKDLYYRLNVINMQIPPLRQRKGDIPYLYKHFLDKITAENQVSPLSIEKEALDALEKYAWPGNVRELQNMAERSYYLNKNGVIHLHDVLEMMGGTMEVPTLAQNVEGKTILESRNDERIYRENEEHETLLRLLESNHGNATQTAKDMGISRTALYRKLKKYTIKE